MSLNYPKLPPYCVHECTRCLLLRGQSEASRAANAHNCLLTVLPCRCLFVSLPLSLFVYHSSHVVVCLQSSPVVICLQHTHTHTHTHTHARTHTHVLAHIDADTHTRTRTHTHTHVRAHTRTQTHYTHTHTHRHAHTLVCTTARTGYMAPIQGVSQQEVTRLVVPLVAGTLALCPHLHCPLSALGYSSMGSQDP